MTEEIEETKYDYITHPIVLRNLTYEDPDLAELPDHEITANANPSSELWQLRARLWELIDRSEKKMEKFGKTGKITVDTIRKGICSRSRFNNYMADPYKAAFICRPMVSPEDRIDNQVMAARARLWEIMSLPISDKDGKPDKAVAKLVFDVAKMMVEHKFGTPLQRSQTISKVQTQKVPAPQDMSVIDEELKLLNERVGKISSKASAEGSSSEEDSLDGDVSLVSE